MAEELITDISPGCVRIIIEIGGKQAPVTSW